MRIPKQLYEEVYSAMGRSFLPTASNDLVHIQVSAVKETLWTARASEDCHLDNVLTPTSKKTAKPNHLR